MKLSCFGLIVLAALMSTLAFFAPSIQAQPEPGSPAALLFEDINNARTAQNLSPLVWDAALEKAAVSHAELVRNAGQLSHQFEGEPELSQRASSTGSHFQSIAENIASGSSSSQIQNEWMNSPPHRQNILDPRMNAIGIAIAEKKGSLYAVADFASTVPSYSLAQAEANVYKLLAARGIQPTEAVRPGTTSAKTIDARQTCEMDHGSAGGSRPLFIMRWQSADLSQLPRQLLDRIASGGVHTASVGACAPAGTQTAFSLNRIAVLLY